MRAALSSARLGLRSAVLRTASSIYLAISLFLYLYISVYIYIYIYVTCLSLSLYIYIYLCVYLHDPFASMRWKGSGRRCSARQQA